MKVPEKVIQSVKEDETDLKYSMRNSRYGSSRRGRGRGKPSGPGSRHNSNRNQQSRNRFTNKSQMQQSNMTKGKPPN